MPNPYRSFMRNKNAIADASARDCIVGTFNVLDPKIFSVWVTLNSLESRAANLEHVM